MMDNFLQIGLMILVVAPISLGVMMIVAWKGDHSIWLQWYLVILLSVLCIIGFQGEFETQEFASFLGEPLFFSVSSTAIRFLILLFCILLISLFLHQKMTVRPLISRVDTSLICLSITACLMAFFSGQFMLRYILLEMIGLLSAVMVGNRSTVSRSFTNFSTVFITLRLGDLFLLSSLLAIQPYSKSFNISLMLNALMDIPLHLQRWILLGFVLAVMVKSGLWPFSFWLSPYRESSKIFHWTPTILMPALGYYLLYRLSPVIQTSRMMSLIIAGGSFLVIFLLMLIYSSRMGKTRMDSRILSVSGFFAIALSALGSPQSLLLYILVLIVFRFSLSDLNPLAMIKKPILTLGFLTLLNGSALLLNFDFWPTYLFAGWVALTGFVAVWQWRAWAQSELASASAEMDLVYQPQRVFSWIYQNVEIRLFAEGTRNFAKAAHAAVIGLYSLIEVGIFHHGISRFTTAVSRSVKWVYTHIESGFDQGLDIAGNWLVRMSEIFLFRYEDGGQTKARGLMKNALTWINRKDYEAETRPLRLDLAWIPILLAVILFMFVFLEMG